MQMIHFYRTLQLTTSNLKLTPVVDMFICCNSTSTNGASNRSYNEELETTSSREFEI